MTSGETLRLLIVEESGSDAESLASELRNAGHSINYEHVNDGDGLRSALERQNPDIVICGSGDGLPEPQQVCSIVEGHAAYPAIIAIADEAGEADVVRMRKCGVTDLVSYQHPEHLCMAFDRQVETIRLRHRVNRLERKLLDGEQRCQALIENSSDAIAYIHDGMHVYANAPYLKLFAIESPEEIEGMPVLDMISEGFRDRFRELLKGDIENTSGHTTLDIECVSPREGRFGCTMECSPATMTGEPCVQILVRVQSTNSELEERIRTLSQRDMLTGLLNRQHFMKVLEQRIGNRPDNRGRALLYLTLDNFKAIRDEVGLAASDLVLCDVARLIAARCSREDTLSRFGDYSFVILTQEADSEAIQQTGAALLENIAGHLCEAGGRSFAMTASIGICVVSEHDRDTQKLISCADMACEVARTSGGNRKHTHSNVVAGSMDQEHTDEWERIISSTLENERLYLVYQPIVSLKGDTTPRYEVLLRVLDESGHTISPGQFLSIAVKSGRGCDIDRWVIEHACAKLAELRSLHDAATFFIKLTAATLQDDGMPEWLRDRLRKYGLEGSGIVFEIAEDTAAADLKAALSFTKAAQPLGCRVALEHAGRCSDTQQVLHHLPVDIIKIDGTLVTDLTGNKEAQNSVRAIMDIAKKSGRICIAEMVEDSACLAQLWQLGMHYIQGYFIQEPSRDLSYVFESETA